LLRGVAVGLVLLRHAWPSAFPGAGIVGVTIFFTLSGYLITGIIRREVERTGRLSFNRFYWNRALRLLPALVVLLLVFIAVELTLSPLDQPERVLPTVLAALFYVADVPGIPLASGMTHLWTLAVEEQFYLIWPTALIFATRWRRVGALLGVAAGGWLAVCAVSLAVAPGGPQQIYTLPTTWAITLVVGAALQVYQDNLPRMAGWLAAAAGLVLTGMSLMPDARDRAETFLVGGPVVALATSVLILFAMQGERVAPLWQPLRWLGLISYATYLWNYLILRWLEAWVGEGPLASWLSVPCTVAAAAVSWVLVERPANGWKERLAARQLTRTRPPQRSKVPE
jgi:peptidoglycan/LPS O-acetylase OafA/YrhL